MPESGRCINNATSSEAGLAYLLQVFDVTYYWSHLDYCGKLMHLILSRDSLGGSPPSWGDPGLGLPRHCFLIVSIHLLFLWPLDSALSQNPRGRTALNFALLPACPLTLSRPMSFFFLLL